MGKALYRKYRSKDLSEIVGQQHVVTALRNALKEGKIAHAYLLTGPRGTGKTSIARIIAHEVNGLVYSEDPHFDIIEIDAASNNGVEDVRELREKVQTAPTSAKYKVYIIDEVHMLSKPAFNALLKTLEEPPEHVIFILATTDVHKVPETIISRTQRFVLKPVALETVTEHLRSIAQKEKIEISDDALSLIAEHGEGSFRDSIGLLDQASSLGKHIEQADIEQLLGRAPSQLVRDLTEAVRTRQSVTVVSVLDELYGEGYEAPMIAVQLGKALRNGLTHTADTAEQQALLAVLRDLLDVPASARPSQMLEIVLLQHAIDTTSSPMTKVVEEKPVSSQKPDSQHSLEETIQSTTKPLITDTVVAEDAEESALAVSPSIEEPKETPAENEAVEPDNPTIQLPSSGIEDADALWHEVLQIIKKTHNTLYGIARMARPYFVNDTLVLELKFPFHQKRLSEAKNNTILTACVAEKRGRQTPLQFVITDDQNPQNSAKPDISTISNIFGAAELIE